MRKKKGIPSSSCCCEQCHHHEKKACQTMETRNETDSHSAQGKRCQIGGWIATKKNYKGTRIGPCPCSRLRAAVLDVLDRVRFL